MRKYDNVLAQITDVFCEADDSNYRRQKVYKNHCCLNLTCDATNEELETMACTTKSKEKISRNIENVACLIMLLHEITTLI